MPPPSMPSVAIATGLLAQNGIELLTWPTSNGHKPVILLEELRTVYGTNYTVQAISLPDRVQKQPWYLALNPQGKVPVLVDHDRDLVMAECSTILQYLARVHDKNLVFSFSEEKDALKAEQWISFAQGDLSPSSGACVKYYRFLPQRHAFGIAQSHREMLRLFSVLDSALEGKEYLVGEKYSIADMSCFTHVNSSMFVGVGPLDRWPNLKAWCERINSREGLQRAMKVPFVREYGNAALARMLAEGGDFAKGEEVLQTALKNALEEFPNA